MERIQKTLAGLKENVNVQKAMLKDLELDVGSMHEEIRRLDQGDDSDRFCEPLIALVNFEWFWQGSIHVAR